MFLKFVKSKWNYDQSLASMELFLVRIFLYANWIQENTDEK